ncbi:MAG TPA: gliding motility-associated ABC transporter substrate-binding protein GldG [Chitinophagaceae bacterium]|nr:gliding motility-associated ABC transporter substrate-binding protein GldG [Chitinophagaceae bacterium]
MKIAINKIWSSAYWWVFLLFFIVIINLLATFFHARFDLTKERRYTLSRVSKELLLSLDKPVMIDVFIEGKTLPPEVRRLKSTITEFLATCKEFGKENIQYQFINPYDGLNDSLQQKMEDSLYYYFELYPSILDAPDKVGDKPEISKIIHGAVVRYGDTTMGVNFIKGVKNYGTEREQRAALYNDIEARLEYSFMHSIQKITANEKPTIAFALGHGQPWGYNVNDAVMSLIKNYRFDTINIKQDPFIPSSIDALVIAKPTQPFTDDDKLKIDQYVMRGGHILWMIDNMYAEFDSLYKSNGFIAFDRGLNLEDILFRYGVRINQNLLQDVQCDKLGQMSSNPDNPQPRLVDWPFFPVLNGTSHPITKNLDGVLTMFPNTLDTVKAEGIKKTFLLKSSSNARTLQAPAKVDFEFLQIAPDIKLFTIKDTGVAILLEGYFQSLYTSRISKPMADYLQSMNVPFRTEVEHPGKMIVVADGDIALNQYNPQNGPLPMGYNFYTRYTYANHDFFINAIEYLVNPSGIMEVRAKDFTLRLLDPVKVTSQKNRWQFINIAVPILLVLFSGFVYQQIRKGKYAA